MPLYASIITTTQQPQPPTEAATATTATANKHSPTNTDDPSFNSTQGLTF